MSSNALLWSILVVVVLGILLFFVLSGEVKLLYERPTPNTADASRAQAVQQLQNFLKNAHE